MKLSDIIKNAGFTNILIAKKIKVDAQTLTNWTNNIEMMPFCKGFEIACLIDIDIVDFIKLLKVKKKRKL